MGMLARILGAAGATPPPEIREDVVTRIIAARQAYDEGRATAADLVALVHESTGHEISEAMDRSGKPPETWAAIRVRRS